MPGLPGLAEAKPMIHVEALERGGYVGLELYIRVNERLETTLEAFRRRLQPLIGGHEFQIPNTLTGEHESRQMERVEGP